MYHYVRDLPNSFYPEIKGLLTHDFIGQLEYLLKHYTIVSMEDCMKAFTDKKKLPKNACLLTFDDGLMDHYINVFPILSELDIKATFFPVIKPIYENIVLDVNKIHYILAKTKDLEYLINLIYEMLIPYRKSYNIPDDKTLFNKFALPYKRDSAEIMFIKRLLQQGLPKQVRNEICLNLFKELVSKNEKVFSKELYMNQYHLKHLIKSGMYIGGHTYEHEWLGKLSEEEQRYEIKKTYEFLTELYNKEPINWVMSYPRNNYNNTTISILKEYNCALGLTANVEIAKIDGELAFHIPRLAPNDIPYSKKSPMNEWTLKMRKIGS